MSKKKKDIIFRSYVEYYKKFFPRRTINGRSQIADKIDNISIIKDVAGALGERIRRIFDS